MFASVRAFLDQIIDYAGLFPPAKLPLEDALKHYLHERSTSPHSRLLRGFVCPTARLQDFLTLTKTHSHPLDVVVLGQQGAQASDFLTGVEADLQRIREYRRAWGAATAIEPAADCDDEVDDVALEKSQREYAGIQTYEVALPKGTPVESLADQIADAAGKIDSARLRGFIEVPFTQTWAADVERLTRVGVGLKLRTGGLTADAFPGDAQVAFFIARCRDAGVPWKATAGLHHPRRHLDPTLNVWHHGFLNVFGAGVLASAHPLTEADIAEILADREGQHFHFERDSLAWKSWSCTTRQIAEARANFATSFGSCSFEEPCEDLIAMGLLTHDLAW